MTVIQAFVLGLVQGLTEFLPISSSGHLLLTRNLFGLTGDYIFFDLMLHIGTLLSIAVFMKKEIIALFKPPFGQAFLIIVASIPAIIVGFAMRDVIGQAFSDAQYIGFFFLGTAVLLLFTQWLSKYTENQRAEVGIKAAIYMGLAQSVAILPGVSRSGSTIAGGTLSNTNRQSLAKFSFLMSIPIILGGALVESLNPNIMSDVNIYNIVIGSAASFASGLVAINLMLKAISKANYKWFSLYLAVLGIASLVIYFF